jgi:hypothetical protein
MRALLLFAGYVVALVAAFKILLPLLAPGVSLRRAAPSAVARST